MLQYPVLSPISHDNEPYKEGDTITLEPTQADPLIAMGVLGEGVEVEKPDPKKAKTPAKEETP